MSLKPESLPSTTRTIRILTADAARAVIAEVVVGAESLGKKFAVTVVDALGTPIAFLRMDGATLQSVQISGDKAYTAAGFGIPTAAFAAREAEPGRPSNVMMASIVDRMVPLAGGVPVVLDGEVVGAVGVSGGTGAEDAALATAAIATVFGA